MNKTCLALVVPVLVVSLGAAQAQSAHNAETGAQTSNAYDTAETACSKQPARRTCAEPDPRPGRPLPTVLAPRDTPKTVIASTTLSADALDRIRNEN